MNEFSNYDPKSVEQHFDAFGDREWARMVAAPSDEVSLYIHTFYLKKYIPENAYVLEIGAGPGRFTEVISACGARVVVGDISQVQLDLNRQNSERRNFEDSVEQWLKLDICNMGVLSSRVFDCVVAYGGVLSYVLDRKDTALAECLRVLKPGGVLLLSVMSLWGSAHRRLDGVLSIPAETNQAITSTGDISEETFARGGNYMHLFRAGELKDWLWNAGLEILALSASNCLSTGWDAWLLERRHEKKTWEELLRMELEACAEEGSLNMGAHIIGAARKKAV